MRYLRNERGVALLTAIMLSMLALLMISAALYLITKGIKVSAASKRYKNAREAAYAVPEVVGKDIFPQILSGYSTSRLATDFHSINLKFSDATGQCLRQKMNNPTSAWSQVAGCTPPAPGVPFDPKAHYDMSFNLKGLPLQPGYNVYSQIVDTVKGNSDKSGVELLDGGGGVTSGSSGITPMHLPSLYTIEVQAEKEVNPQEKARLSVLYSY